jgi:DNA-binding NtrC family response regulator
MAAHVLVVDDDAAERHHLEQILTNQGYSVECAVGGESALARLARPGVPPVSAIILDLVMPDLDGMAVLERLNRYPRRVPVIVQTGARGSDASISALQAGAFDFLVKPATAERVKASLTNALKATALENEILRIRGSRSEGLGLGDIVARSASMNQAIGLGARAARSSVPVLIEGSAGTGKEVLARTIHNSGGRRGQPFVSIRADRQMPNGVSTKHIGDRMPRSEKLREAKGGTLFIQDVDTLPLSIQSDLAEMLAASSNSRKPHVLPGDVRLIAASTRRLIDLVAEGKFNEGLYNFLNIHPIWLPPLKQRAADIPALAENLVVRLAAEAGRADVAGISRAATELLLGYDWPGNLPQLEQMILRAVVLCPGGELAPQHFPSLLQDASPSRPAAEPTSGQDSRSDGVAVPKQNNPHRSPGPGALADRLSFSRYGVARLLDERGEMRPIGSLEEEVIRFAIDHYRGRMTEVARRLGIGRSTLYRKMRDYGITQGAPAVS